MDLIGLNRLSMESSGPNRVRGDSRSRPNSLASGDGGQASHAPSIHEKGQATGGAVDILGQIAQALQRVVQLVQVVPQQTVIERMEKILTHRIPWKER